MTFVWAHPQSLWALLPVVAWLWALRRRGIADQPVAALLRHPSLGGEVGAVEGGRQVAWWLQLLAAALAVLALARPQEVGAWVQPPPEGRDIALVVDTSLTMSLEDFRQEGQGVSRMAMLKAVLGDFVQRRQADRFSLAVFGSEAATLTPPTFDREHLVAQLRRLQVGALGDNTALGDALGLALAPLQSGRLPPVMVLVSDGEPSNSGDMTPAEAVAVARQLGVAIHTLQVGAPAGPASVTPTTAPADDVQPSLADIARLTGGRHWVARSTEAVREVMQDIDRLAVTLQPPPTEREHREWFVLPLGLSVLLLAFAHVLRTRGHG